MGTQEPRSTTAAVLVAEQYVEGTVRLLNLAHNNPEFAIFIDELRRGYTRDGAEGARVVRPLVRRLAATFGAHEARVLAQSVHTAEAAKLWRRHRVVYRVHQGLADCLVDTDTKTAVPCEVFGRLPHPDPFVVFPTPMRAPLLGNSPDPIAEPGMFVGMLITGVNEHEQVCSTADPDVRQLCVALACKVRYEGLPPTYEETNFYVPLSGTRSIDDLLDYCAEFDRTAESNIDEDRVLLNLAVSLLLYLCSDQRDAQEHVARKGKRDKAIRQKKTAIVDLGFDIGPALESARRPSPGGSDANGNLRVRPHLRRAHWHTYWVGPRDHPTPEIRWLHPIVVNKQDGQSRATVVDVAKGEPKRVVP